MADIEDASDFLIEALAAPINGLSGVIGKSVSRLGLDPAHGEFASKPRGIGRRRSNRAWAVRFSSSMRTADEIEAPADIRPAPDPAMKLSQGIGGLAEATRVRLLGFCQSLEPIRDLRESFLARRLRHPGIHVGIFVGLAVHRRFEIQHRIADRQIGGRISYLLQIIEMPVSMAGLAFGSIAEQPRDFRLPFDIGDLGEVEIAALGLYFAGKRLFEIFMSFASF